MVRHDVTNSNSPTLSSRSSTTTLAERVKNTEFNSISSISASLLSYPLHLFHYLVFGIYYLYQTIIDALFTPPYRPVIQPRGRIAIIGAGLSGISTAAAFIANGYEVVIYDSDEKIGGIWARVNATSRLQLNSLMYRFHPSIKWSEAYPKRDEILANIQSIAEKYHMGSSFRLNTPVRKVTRHESSTAPKDGGHARWIINDGKDGIFDAVVGTIGSCGEPKLVELSGHKSFRGKIYHSSELDDADLTGQRVVIVGSGASGLEAAELCVAKKAAEITVLARDDKWIIPRRTLFDIALALKPYGAQTRLSWIPEEIIRRTHYRDLVDVSPASNAKGLFEGTPIVNNDFLLHIRQGLVDYKRGDALEITPQGVKFAARPRGSRPGENHDESDETIEKADVIIMATGYKTPSVAAFPADLFPVEGDRSYARPDLYLQTFSTEDWSILLTNAAYKNAIGSVGDRNTRPSPRAMKTWVDVITWLKVWSFGPGKNTAALDFFTYTELLLFLVGFHLLNLSRLKWLPFVLFGWNGPRPRFEFSESKNVVP